MTLEQLNRDYKLNSINRSFDVSIDTSKLFPMFYFLTKNRRILKDFIRRGFILTGSRALSCYRVNKKSILNRKPNDWDFLITKEQFLEVCRDYKVYDFDPKESTYTFNKSFMVIEGSYSGVTNIMRFTSQLIIKDELPTYTIKNGIKIAELDSIINCKLEYVKTGHNKEKHRKDLNNIFLNCYNFKNESK